MGYHVSMILWFHESGFIEYTWTGMYMVLQFHESGFMEYSWNHRTIDSWNYRTMYSLNHGFVESLKTNHVSMYIVQRLTRLQWL